MPARPGAGPAFARRFAPRPRRAPVSGFRLPATKQVRGLNISGAEFTPTLGNSSTGFSNRALGTYNSDYHYEGVPAVIANANGRTFAYLRSRGWNYVKIPTRWERLGDQFYNGGTGSPDPATLNATEVARLTAELDQAYAAGLQVCIDLHNFGCLYVDGSITGQSAAGTGWRWVIGSTWCTQQNFADFWSAMTSQFIGHPGLYGFHIMNEPNAAGGFTQAAWYAAAQAAYTAIRSVDPANTLVVRVGGWHFSDLFNWQGVNQATPFIAGAAADRNLWFEAHHYWSENNNGQYTSYANALAFAVSLGFSASQRGDAMYARLDADLKGLATWLDNNGLARSQGVIGECAWPNRGDTESPGDQVLWNRLGEFYLARLGQYGFHIDAWCCGEFYAFPGSDPLPLYYATAGQSSGVSTTQPVSYAWEGSLAVQDNATATESTGAVEAVPLIHVGDSVSFP